MHLNCLSMYILKKNCAILKSYYGRPYYSVDFYKNIRCCKCLNIETMRWSLMNWPSYSSHWLWKWNSTITTPKVYYADNSHIKFCTSLFKILNIVERIFEMNNPTGFEFHMNVIADIRWPLCTKINYLWKIHMLVYENSWC